MRDNDSKQNIRHTGRNIWIVVLVLVMILIITLTLIGAILGGLSGGDRNIIPLFYDGDREILKQQGWSYIRVEQTPEMLAQDARVSWETNTRVDLFKTAYANDQGQITVESGDGEKVIAPGTSNEYEFSLKNTGNISLDYAMTLGSVFTFTNRELPMEIRLRSGDRWILGGDRAWARPEELKELKESGTVPVNQYITYTFEWRWPFESGIEDTLLLSDLNDTVLGNAAVEQKVEFQLDIGVQSTVTAGAVPSGPRGEELLTPLTLWNLLRWGVFPGLLLGLGLILLIFWRTPVYVTGFLPAVGELHLGRKKDTLGPNGRFLFPKVYMGKHSLKLEKAEYRIKLKRKRKLPGLAFESKDDVLVIFIGRKVRAVELYLLPTLAVRQDEWAAIDKDHNVITPAGVQEPDENQENTTPGGLHIRKNGELEIEAFAPVK